MFPLEMREQIKLMLAGSLVAIFSQRLLPRVDKPGVIPAIEILLNVGAVKDILLDPTRLDEIPELLRRNKAAYGTQILIHTCWSYITKVLYRRKQHFYMHPNLRTWH
jgi:Tfp pilus assembly protein, pilus retraction ATPase PilT